MKNQVPFFVFILLVFFSIGSFAQPPKFEDTELTGKVVKIDPGFSFAYTTAFFDIGNDRILLNYHPKYSRRMMEILRPGSTVTFRARVNLKTWESVKGFRESDRNNEGFTQFLIVGTITHVLVGNNWEVFPVIEPKYGEHPLEGFRFFLDKPVRQLISFNNFNKGFMLDDGVVGWSSGVSALWDPLKDTRKGDVISFMGYPKDNVDPQYAYPINGVKEVFSFSPLIKAQGKIRSMLFKQNSVCIGISVQSGRNTIEVSFPTQYGEKIKAMSEKPGKVTLYYSPPPKVKNIHPPELHVLINGTDSLVIDALGFWGGADGKHEHKPATVSGTITGLNRSDAGKLVSMVLDDEILTEVDAVMERQLGQYLRRGRHLQVKGQERMRKAGEVYAKDYRIIVPQEVLVDGKTFILNNQP